MASRVSKATKKFQSKHLRNAIDKRRKDKEYNKRIQSRRGNKTLEQKRELAGTKDEQRMRKSVKEEVFRDLSVEKFFSDGFSVPKASKKMREISKNQRNDSDSDESAEDLNSEDETEMKRYLEDNHEELVGNEDKEEEEQQQEERNHSNLTEITEMMIKKWDSELVNKPNLKSIKNITRAFQLAAIDEDNIDIKGNSYYITSEEVLESVIAVGLNKLPKAIVQIVAYKEKKGVRSLANGSTVTELIEVMKYHLPSLLNLLSTLTDVDTIFEVLSSIKELLPYIIADKKNTKKLINSLVTVWADIEDDLARVCIVNFLCEFCTEYKKDLLEKTLKLIYTAFVKGCRKTNKDTIGVIISQIDSITELFKIDEATTYTIGFESIRQLALHLKSAISSTSSNNTSEDPTDVYKTVYNWQFIHSLDFWSKVLIATYDLDLKNKDSPAKQLAQPIISTTISFMRLIPTEQFLPLRFYLLRTLINIIQQTGLSIPVFPYISEILFSNTFAKPGRKNEELEEFDFFLNFKCSPEYIGTKVYQTGAWSELIAVIAEFLIAYCKSISFPELVTPVILSIRRFNDIVTNGQFNSPLYHLSDKLTQHCQYIERMRSNVIYSPSNTSQATKFLADVTWEETPLGPYLKSHRKQIQLEEYEDEDELSDIEISDSE
ncbi:hypothetical protein Kpol_479p13 [Vanderwaltozyma polyspora DSM 70294]|uniref:Nucleolar complex protein 2 n=1 Tax=Vanderwaltozyma polyspora (strain ATCC 22028 / DSM 70294 / BCRC 21397 / CBS 2163 / NBRC 10782 / NRRL Y-8283 / UCD 57-17) TaxID=436907 RepID=A7TQC6_VANPO|nr:uncharacterized protein Kpol_479p13 [Vanderwaltozyma polyspora DSM 70294]EDO15525.1 hypothetical protein Kpol_479p13 [Vanderwaltozyma polyspora DSM 70294]